jgi:uncharacterized protein (TIGR03437 family)
MLNRYVSLGACLCLIASVTALGQSNQGTGYVFELPGAGTSGSQFQGFIYNGGFLSPDIPSTTGPLGTSQIIPKPDGSKFYVLGNGGLETFDPTFTKQPGAVNGITGSVCVATITPDGKYLLVGAAATCGQSTSSALYILDTSTDTILTNTVPALTGGIIGFAVSPDSSTAWMLTDSPSSPSVTQISMSTRAVTAKLGLPYGDLGAITLAPTGLLYVTAGGVIYEINPNSNMYTCNQAFTEIPPLCITPTGYVQVRAKPGPLRFTPSGQTAYMINTDPTSGPTSLLEMSFPSLAVSSWPSPNSGVTPPSLSDVIVAGENLIYTISTTDPNYPTTLWDVTPSPLSAAVSTSLSGIFPTTSVLSATVSNELPSAVYFYSLVSNGNQTNLYRVALANKTYVQTLAIPGVLQFAIIPPETGATSFIQYNATQSVTAGTTALPLTAIILDGTGRPIYNLPVTYTELSTDPTPGVTISGATTVTNAYGYATANAKMPTAPGTYTVVLTAGTATANFSLTIPGSGTGTGTGTGTTNQVNIYSGDGEFLQSNNALLNQQPLTVQVLDTNGKPLENIPVTFSNTGPGTALAGLDNPNATTDVNGLAGSNLTSPQLPPGQAIAFFTQTVNASTTLGSVNFHFTVFQLNGDGTGEPQISMVAPYPSLQLTAGEGDVVANGIEASINSTSFGQSVAVPNVGIRLASGADFTQPGPASCQGSSLSDNTGVAHCNVAISCQAKIGNVPAGISVVVGENRLFTVNLTITAGAAQVVTLKSGNNQSGYAGSTLAAPLVATVSDNCGNSKPALAVTWAVTQGSATLTNTLSTSDGGGNVHTSVLMGQTPGPVQVTVSIGSSSVVFSLTNQVSVAGIQLTSGGGQSVLPNQAFPQPLIFSVTDVNHNPVPGIVVTFAAATGSATVNPQTATTNSSGQVTTNVTAGPTPSNVTVIASYSTFTASANLTVKPTPPSITALSFVNAATVNSLNAQVGLVPCGLASVTGAGLAPSVSGVISGNQLGLGPLPYTLGGLSMTLNNVSVPLLSVSNTNNVQQVNFQTPCELSPGTATAVITVNGTASTITGISVLAVQPGIINYAGPNGKPYGFVIRALDGSYVTPSAFAHRGETYYLVVTGLGQTTPPITTNAAGTGSQVLPLSEVIVGVDNFGVPVNLAEYASGQIGVYVIGFQIPLTAPTGADQPLAVEINSVFGNAVYLPGVQ